MAESILSMGRAPLTLRPSTNRLPLSQAQAHPHYYYYYYYYKQQINHPTTITRNSKDLNLFGPSIPPHHHRLKPVLALESDVPLPQVKLLLLLQFSSMHHFNYS